MQTNYPIELLMLDTVSEGIPLGIRAKVLNCDIVVSEFELQSCYYGHFWTYTL